MTKLIALAGLIILTGCAHAHIESWEQDKITVCGNKWAGLDKMRETAKEQCDKELSVVGGGYRTKGYNLDRGIAGGIVTSERREHCTTFKCE